MRCVTKGLEATYIRMSSDLLDGRVIEMPRVAQETIGDIVCVLETLEDIGRDRELGTLSELSSLNLNLGMDILHPGVVISGGCLRDVLLEDDDVGVGNFNRVGRGEQRSNALVDGLGVQGRCR